MKRVIVNSTPIISLSIIGELNLLNRIFDEVIIPESVYDEIILKGSDKPGCNEFKAAKFIKVMRVNDKFVKTSIMLELDEGEAEVITLALEHSVDIVVIDEFAGRKYAKLMGLNVIGTLGILLKAKQLNLIRIVKPLMDELKSNKRYIDDELYNLVLEMAGE